MFDEDMSVFFNTDEMAQLFIRQRPAQPDLEFAGILGVKSKDSADGYVVGTLHEMRFATRDVDLHDGDELLMPLANNTARAFRVRGEPEPHIDGAESMAYLSEVTGP
jgi:hypothetical protein